jgi:hypothetical protein
MIAAAVARARAGSPMRSFDPRIVGAVECRAWETYYRREWAAFWSPPCAWSGRPFA